MEGDSLCSNLSCRKEITTLIGHLRGSSQADHLSFLHPVQRPHIEVPEVWQLPLLDPGALIHHCRYSSFYTSGAPPWVSRPVSSKGVAHYHLIHWPHTVPTALCPAPLFTGTCPGRQTGLPCVSPKCLQISWPVCGWIHHSPGSAGCRECSSTAKLSSPRM